MKLDFTTLKPWTPDPEPTGGRKRPLIATIITDKLEALGLKRGASLAIHTELPPTDGQLICLKHRDAHLIGVWRDGAAMTPEGLLRAGAFDLVGVVRPLVAFKSIPRGRH